MLSQIDFSRSVAGLLMSRDELKKKVIQFIKPDMLLL